MSNTTLVPKEHEALVLALSHFGKRKLGSRGPSRRLRKDGVIHATRVEFGEYEGGLTWTNKGFIIGGGKWRDYYFSLCGLFMGWTHLPPTISQPGRYSAPTCRRCLRSL